jgi:hypothetical protein
MGVNITEASLSERRAPRSPWLWWVALAATLVSTSILYFIWPIRERLADVVLGSALFAPDAILNIGILEWGYASLRSPDLRLFEWTAGFPLHNTLAATENLVGWQPFYAPLRAAGLGPVAAYNVLMFASVPISGLTTALLARQLGAPRSGAFVAGFVFAFAPFHLSQMVHLQTMAVCWAPLPFVFLDRLLTRATWRSTIGLALAFILVCASSVYMGLFVAIGLALFIAAARVTGRCRLTVPVVTRLAISAVAVVAALSPLLSRYLRFTAAHDIRHPASLIVERSLALEDFVRSPDWKRVFQGAGAPLAANGGSPETSPAPGGKPPRLESVRGAFPGFVAVGLLLSLFVVRRKEAGLVAAGRLLWFLVAVAAVLSLGPMLKVEAEHAFRLTRWIPLPGWIWLVVPGVRNVWKFHILALLFASVLCGFGAAALLSMVRARLRTPLVGGLLTLLAIENWPAAWFARASYELPVPLAVSDSYPFLQREQTAGGVVELPIADSSGVRALIQTRYVYASAGHQRRVVAMRSVAPLAITDSLLDAAAALPNPGSRQRLVAAGVTRLVVHPPLMPADSGERLIRRLRDAGYRVLFSGRSVVFELP